MTRQVLIAVVIVMLAFAAAMAGVIAYVTSGSSSTPPQPGL